MFSVILILSHILCLLYADEECKRNFSVRKNSIILTKASQAKGASFIHKQVVTMFGECYSLCCSNSDCTVAVYENKVNHVCFMFDCKKPNVCLFSEHDDYVSMLLMPEQNVRTPSNPSKETIVRNKMHIRPSMDAALGETCGVMRKCGPANSMCTSGTCICQIAYIGRGKVCGVSELYIYLSFQLDIRNDVKNCRYAKCYPKWRSGCVLYTGKYVRSLCPKPELMFQCLDVSKSPFCVALYDQCNGIAECGDSSDEINCEPNQYHRPVFNETSNSPRTEIKTKPKPKSPEINDNMHSTTNYQRSHHKSHSIIQNQNSSEHYLAPSQKKYQLNPPIHKSNPLAENQLLLLEAKNKPPKYHHRNSNDRSKSNRQYQKPSRQLETNNPVYEKHQYSKFKLPSYPHVSKVDEYYQKGSPDQSELSNRWNNIDSSSNDYDYPQSPSTSSRDINSDWDPDQYSESSYSEAPNKYSPDRSNYVYYPDYEEETDVKPRGRFISDSDRYRPKYSANNGYEHAMDYSNRRKYQQNQHHRVFVNMPNKMDDANRYLTTIPSSKRSMDKLNAADIDSRNMNEWSTAVIALSVGLLVSAALLIAVGFKMRSWRRRLRTGKKGKCLTTDEGDYLINGMYL